MEKESPRFSENKLTTGEIIEKFDLKKSYKISELASLFGFDERRGIEAIRELSNELKKYALKIMALPEDRYLIFQDKELARERQERIEASPSFADKLSIQQIFTFVINLKKQFGESNFTSQQIGYEDKVSVGIDSEKDSRNLFDYLNENGLITRGINYAFGKPFFQYRVSDAFHWTDISEVDEAISALTMVPKGTSKEELIDLLISKKEI